MKRIVVISVILMMFVLPPAMAQNLNFDWLEGVFGGVTAKNGITTQNLELQAGWVMKIGENKYTAVGVTYDTKLGTSAIEIPVIVKLKNRIFLGGAADVIEFATKRSVPESNGTTGYNPVVGAKVSLIYLPDKKIWETIRIGFAATFSVKTFFGGFGKGAQFDPEDIKVDNTGEEFRLTLFLFGT